MSESLPRLTRFADGITAVDTEYVRPQMDASHVVAVGSRAAIVDTGPNTAVPLILAALDELQIPRDSVEYLFLTHVHLDHAGGAGLLMQNLPRAKLVPSRAVLWKATRLPSWLQASSPFWPWPAVSMRTARVVRS